MLVFAVGGINGVVVLIDVGGVISVVVFMDVGGVISLVIEEGGVKPEPLVIIPPD